MSNNQVDAGAATAANAGDLKSSSNEANEATPSNEALDSPIDAHIGSTHEGTASEQEAEGAQLADNHDTSEAMKNETGDGQDTLISPRETMSDDEVCKERETSVNATTADDCEPAVTKEDTVNAKLLGASGSDVPRTETESIDDEIGTVQEEKGACAPLDDQDVQPNVDSSPPIDNSISIEDDNFVVIELVESTNNAEETRDASQERAALLENDELQTSANPSLDINTNTTSNNTSQATNQLTNPNSKPGKKLRHPLLTPLAKLPWDKLANAAGTCDLLFNCKYTQRQVEDEVRQENKTIQYNIHDDEEDVECNVEDLGLHCCSMLEDSDDEGENVAHGKSSQIENQQQQQMESRGDLLVNEEQKVKSWKGSNPTLDMMLYKQFLEE